MKARRVLGAGVAVSLLTFGLYGVAAGSDQSDDGRDEQPAVVDLTALKDPAAPAERPSDEDLAVSDAVTEVAEQVAQLDESDDSGFGTIHTDHEKGALTVYWSGEPPQELLDLAEKSPRGIAVTIEQSSYSRAELSRGAAAIAKGGLYQRLDIMFVNPEVDSGITIGTGRTEPFTDDELTLVREVSKVNAIKVEYNVPPAVGYVRTDDNAPWKGGGRLRVRRSNNTTGLCTVGFPVIVGGTGRLLSAGHCDPETNDIYRDGAGNNIAPAGAAAYRPGIDSLLIDPTASPATIARVYDGGYNTNSKLTVKNYASNWPGDPVCGSGATSGTLCGSVYDDSVDINAFGTVVNVIYARGPAGVPLGATGDSGAPFYKYVAGGVQARGIEVGPVQTEPSWNCQGNPDQGPVSCSRFISYVPMSTILNRWNAALEVG